MTRQRLLHGLISAAAGLLLSFTLAQTFFDLASRTRIDQVFLVLIPAGAVFVCLLYVVPVLES
ncbi:MAG TPA: hypothetical protein DCY14_02105, partial [Anaerolineae bacterium]|nr:hypothetical protein [Anaerolineae bacterium]